MMRNKLMFFVTAICVYSQIAVASIGVKVHDATLAVLTNKAYNVVAEICIDNDASQPSVLNGVELDISSQFPMKAFSSVRLMYTGGMSPIQGRSTSWAMKDQAKRIGGSQNLYFQPGYAEQVAMVSRLSGGKVMLVGDRKLVPGKNYFYVSVSVNAKLIKNIAQTFTLNVASVTINGQSQAVGGKSAMAHRLGYGVRQSGDDNVYSYRIPGLVTSNNGSLIGVYDVRYHTSLDLQDHIDIGMSRSTDGGNSWQKMKIIMDMGKWGGLPEAQNGIGDPSILVDENTGEIFVVAVWTHGLGNNRAWGNVGTGFEPETTAQLMISSSKDDGVTWSQPRNITKQVKDHSWKFTLQGPGRGITMNDGTLVFPIQYIDSTNVPNAAIMYSRDHGQTWQTHNYAKSNTTESQVVEVEDGCLMLNMRDNRKIGRAIYTTRDLGRTWSEHHTSGGTLREPVCMASILKVAAKDNVLQRDLLLFSNPDTTGVRSRMTIKASLDGGDTWSDRYRMLIDEDLNWGYSCLTMIDRETVGILYEGSGAQMQFQAIKLRDIIPADKEDKLMWEKMTPIAPDDKLYSQGVSAVYAGFIGDDLIVAGGANFPEEPAAMGGRKVFYDGIYAMNNASVDNSWRKVGELPKPLAYGVTLPFEDGVVFAGGANADGACKDVFMITYSDSKANVKTLPSLPEALEQHGGAVIGRMLYVVGGLSMSGASSALYACNMDDKTPQWRRLTDMPDAMLQPVVVAEGGSIYVWGGFKPFANDAKGVVYDYGYKYTPATDSWSRISGVPSETFVGAVGVSLDGGKILCMGGVDKNCFYNAMLLKNNIAKANGDVDAMKKEDKKYMEQPAHWYDFNRDLYIYDTATDKFCSVSQSERFARAGAAVVVRGNKMFIINGERKPGIRVADVWRVGIEDVKR